MKQRKELMTHRLARWLRAKIWPDCAIPDTSMKFGTVVDHDWLSRIGYTCRTTLGNAYCACAKHFSDFRLLTYISNIV